MSEDMVERVARAIEAAYRNDDDSRERMRSMAHAAIGAMRTPTPKMLGCAWTAIAKDKHAAGIARLGPGAGFTDWWQAAIDAALSPPFP